MRKIKMLALAMGLAFTALQAGSSSANEIPTCQLRCRAEYEQCQVICSKTPCLVSCDFGLRICLNNCGSES
jgi:hypothetical protein